MAMKTLVALLLAVAAAAFAPVATARAADDPGEPSAAELRARELYRRGDRLYAEGDYEGAIKAFEEAYAISGRPGFLYNLANAYERLGYYEQALHNLRQYAPYAPVEQRDVLAKRIDNLEKRAEKARLGDTGQPDPDLPPPPDPVPPDPDPLTTKKTLPEPPPPIAGYVLLGVGAVGVGLGAAFGVAALGARDDAQAACAPVRGVRYCTDAAREALDDHESSALVADIAIGVGVVAAAVGLYLVLDPGEARASQPDPPVVGFELAPTAGGGGEIRVGGRF